MTIEQTYYPSPGLNQIYDATLAYVKVLMVARSGTVYDVLISNNDISINTRQVLYQPSFGALVFNSEIPFISGESVNIIYDPNI